MGRIALRGIELTKKDIRSKMLWRLKTQKEADRDRKSKSIKRKLFKASVFKKAKTVMFYISLDGEVNTVEMIKSARRLGKIIAVPVCTRRTATIRPCVLQDKAALGRGPLGAREPLAKKPISIRRLDLVIVPGVAFDSSGRRLGRGRGCYDRFLSRLPRSKPSVGLAFDFQVLPDLPATGTDVSVQKVICN